MIAKSANLAKNALQVSSILKQLATKNRLIILGCIIDRE